MKWPSGKALVSKTNDQDFDPCLCLSHLAVSADEGNKITTTEHMNKLSRIKKFLPHEYD